ncbi:MAG: general secretion pathway protein GspB, partial [Acidobacteriota bacterium]
MSYILDALKKAERERGIAKVPTLTTVHDIYERPRNRSWGTPIAVMILLAAGMGFLLYFWTRPTPPVPGSPDFSEQEHEAGPPTLGSVNFREPDKTDSASGQQKQLQNTTSYKSPVPTTETAGLNTGDQAAPGIARIQNEEMLNPSPPAKLPTQTEITTSNVPNIIDETLQLPKESAGDIGLEDSLPFTRDSPSQTSALQEAMQGMNITILMFAEDPADRLVFINGRKYVEGDYVDGLYLIESITQD